MGASLFGQRVWFVATRLAHLTVTLCHRSDSVSELALRLPSHPVAPALALICCASPVPAYGLGRRWKVACMLWSLQHEALFAAARHDPKLPPTWDTHH